MYSKIPTNTSPASTTLGLSFAELLGRISLAAIFLISGVGKISAYAQVSAHMASAGVSGSLLPLVIITEIMGFIAIVIGYKTRVVAFLLAGFTLLAGLAFHRDVADQNQAIHLLKNIAIMGGFLALWANGAGAFSLDERLKRKKTSASRETVA